MLLKAITSAKILPRQIQKKHFISAKASAIADCPGAFLMLPWEDQNEANEWLKFSFYTPLNTPENLWPISFRNVVSSSMIQVTFFTGLVLD